MKGIILAGGSGTRLYPITKGVSKQLLPIYNKPMIYYPLSVLMLAGINEILIITTEEDLPNYRRLLGNGEEFGIHLTYRVQIKPNGLAEAFILGEDFIQNQSVCLILGDNIFYGSNLSSKLKLAISQNTGATIFGYQVKNPTQFGVAEIDKNQNVISIEEKPKFPKSNLAITGLYFYDKEVTDLAKKIRPSQRGELEISDLNTLYLQKKKLKLEILGRGFTWLDTGTTEGLLEAGSFVSTIEKSQGFKIACLEEIGFKNGWISTEDLGLSIKAHKNSEYGNYLKSLIKN